MVRKLRVLLEIKNTLKVPDISLVLKMGIILRKIYGGQRTIPFLDVSGDWLQFVWEEGRESDWVFDPDEQNRADASW